MKNKTIIKLFLGISFICFYTITSVGQTLPNDTVNKRYDDSDQLPKKLSYYKIADKVIISLIVTEYSNDIIYYDLTIKALPKKQITQKGYAINPSSRLNGGVESAGNDKTGKEIIVQPYYSSFCSCDDDLSFGFYRTTDKSKIKISSSRQMKYDLFKEKSILAEGDPRGTVDLFGFLYLLEN